MHKYWDPTKTNSDDRDKYSEEKGNYRHRKALIEKGEPPAANKIQKVIGILHVPDGKIFMVVASRKNLRLTSLLNVWKSN